MNEQVIAKLFGRFIEKPGRMDMGAGKMSRRYKCTPEEAREARRRAKSVLKQKVLLKTPKKNRAKVLVFDIETLPLLAYVWMTYKQHVGNAQKRTKMHSVVTWVAKWLHEDEIIEAKLTPQEIDDEDDSRIVKQLRDLFDAADIVIGHNIDKFDVPIINTKCLIAGIEPPSAFRTVDTLKIAKKTFRFPDNKLQSMCEALGMEGKLHTDFDLWRGCMLGSTESREKYIQDMLTYNIQDVKQQEEVYLEVLPWVKSHPNMAQYVKGTEKCCTNCGSTNLEKDGYYYTSIGKFQTYKCTSCGAKAGRDRKNLNSKEKNKSLLMPVAR
jgi:DNA polymerase elongation subunit (family B)